MKHRRVIPLASAALLAFAGAAPRALAQGAVPVAAREIARGIELTSADISADTMAASRIGWVTRRVIHEGEPLKEPAVAPAQLVHAGLAVTVRAESGGVVVTGTALSSGSLGDRIRVRLDSQHTITGIVASSAMVKIQ